MSEPNAAVLALQEYGRERQAFWANPPRGACEVDGCLEDDAILQETSEGVKVCAHHYRAQADRDKPYPCDSCGEGPAFRDPLGRKDEMLCTDCHARSGYVPGERAMVNKVAARVGVEHPMARRVKCMAAGITDCGGEVKQRGSVGLLCNRHHDPVKYDKARQA